MIIDTTEKRFIMGVDPGIKGAVAFWDFKTRELAAVCDFPIREIDGHNEIDGRQLSNLISLLAERTVLCVFEKVGFMPHDGKPQIFSFARSVGIASGVIQTFDIPMFFPLPQVWKSLAGLSKDKNLSRERAMKVFENKADLFKRKKDDGRAEAALLAVFGERFLKLVV